MENFVKSRHRLFFFFTGFVYIILIFARDWKAINRIGADTGYSFVPDAVNGNFTVLFRPFIEYYELGSRVAAEIVSVFPIRYHAIASSTVVNLIWVLLALFIFTVIAAETTNASLPFFSGLALILNPYAMESSLGNIGTVKFAMTAVVAIAFCSRHTIKRYPKLITALTLVTGLTQPILLVTVIPLFWLLRSSDRIQRRRITILLSVVVLTSMIQLSEIGLIDAFHGKGQTSVKSFWPGMGLFWYSGVLFPTLFSIILVLANFTKRFQTTKFKEVRNLLCVSTISLSASCYFLGGIADRYFVAPMTLAGLSGLLLLHDILHLVAKNKKIIIVFAVGIALIPTVKWFEAGWYLTSGPTWTSEVDRAKLFCAGRFNSVVELFVSPDSSAVISCDRLKF